MQEYQSATKSCRSSFHHSDHKPGLDDDDNCEDHVIVVVVRMGMRTHMVKMVMVMIITML